MSVVLTNLLQGTRHAYLPESLEKSTQNSSKLSTGLKASGGDMVLPYYRVGTIPVSEVEF